MAAEAVEPKRDFLCLLISTNNPSHCPSDQIWDIHANMSFEQWSSAQSGREPGFLSYQGSLRPCCFLLKTRQDRKPGWRTGLFGLGR